MNIEKSFVIIGEISSGKSTLARRLSEELAIPKASFGGYLSHYCKLNHVPEGQRQDLQNLGQKMIDEDSTKFLKNVIAFSSSNPIQLIFEGVRHDVILKEISSISKRIASIYVDASYEQRLYRYLSREKKIDVNKTEADFRKASAHPVEREVPTLKSKCSFIIQSTDSEESDFTQLKSFIELWHNK